MEKDNSVEKPGLKYELLIIGCSAGGVDAILKLLLQLPEDFPVPIIIIIHRYPSNNSDLDDVFQLKTSLKLRDAEEKEKITRGKIYLAPADYHLLIENDQTISLDDSEKVNYSRPSIDVTFEQAAEVYKNKLIGVLLTGANRDGAEGMLKINRNGGFTIVQNPATAEVSTMPQAALMLCDNHKVLNLEDIIPYILQNLLILNL